MANALIGIDIGGTKSAVILGDTSGQVLAREQIETTDVKTTLGKLIDHANALRKQANVAACGISCGGPLSSRDGLILSPPNLPGWDRVPVTNLFATALAVPTALENDANAAAVAEWDWGLHRTVDDLIYLTCGTGQGAGLIFGGRLHRGRQDLAGEVGHVRLLDTGPVGYGKAGSVEGLTSGSGLGKLAMIRLQNSHPRSALDELSIEQITGKAVGDAALAGDEVAIAIVNELGTHLGRLCAILIDTLNPQRISLGSMAHRLGDLLLVPVRNTAQQECLPTAFEHCVIERSALGHRTQDLAALAVARQAVRTDHAIP